MACPPSRATACLIRLCPHLRVTACAFRPNGMAVHGSLVLGLTGMRLFVRVGVVECAVAVTQRQPVRANAAGHRTSIPFGHHAVSKTLALADDIALSEPPDIYRPNGISVSQVFGVTAECVYFKKPAIPGFFCVWMKSFRSRCLSHPRDGLPFCHSPRPCTSDQYPPSRATTCQISL